MNKLRMFAYLLLTVLLGVLLLPGALGFIAERQIQAQLQAPQAPMLEELKLRALAYDRGWFSSRMLLVSELDPELQQETHIYHGPINWQPGWFVGLYATDTIVGAHSSVSPSTLGELTQMLAEAQMDYLVKVNTRTSWFGNTTFEAKVPAASAEMPGEGALEFAGMDVKGGYQPGSAQLQVAAVVGDLSIRGQEGQLEMQGMQLALDGIIDGAVINRFLWLGSSNLVLKRLVAEPCESCLGVERADYAFAITDFVSAVDTFDTSGLITFSTKNAASLVQVGTTSLTDLKFDGRAERISKSLLASNGEILERMTVTMQNSPNPTGDNTQADASTNRLLEAALASEPGIVLEPVQFQYDGLPLSFDLNLRITASEKSAPLAVDDALHWLTLLDRIELAAQLDFHQQLAHKIANQFVFQELSEAGMNNPQQRANLQTPMILANVVERGYLAESGDNYTAQLKFTKGVFTVNGTEFPLGALLGASMLGTDIFDSGAKSGDAGAP